MFADVCEVRFGLSSFWQWPVVEYQRDGFDRWYGGHTLGTLEQLIQGYIDGAVPLGVVIDRLEEYPEEVDGLSVDRVRECVEWLRANYTGFGERVSR